MKQNRVLQANNEELSKQTEALQSKLNHFEQQFEHLKTEQQQAIESMRSINQATFQQDLDSMRALFQEQMNIMCNRAPAESDRRSLSPTNKRRDLKPTPTKRPRDHFTAAAQDQESTITDAAMRECDAIPEEPPDSDPAETSSQSEGVSANAK
jgi:hypothetical protein